MRKLVTGITLGDDIANPGGGDPVQLSVGCHGFYGVSDTTEIEASTPEGAITIRAYSRGVAERRALIASLRRAADMIEAASAMVGEEK